MTPTVVLLAVSTALQFGAAALAIRLVRITDRRFGWSLVAAAVTLMGVRRSITLYHVLGARGPEAADPVAEVVALAISALIFLGILGVGRLFEAYRRSEARLRASQERYRQAVENSPNPIFTVERHGRIQRWNPACERVFGYSAEEAIGRPMAELLALDDASKVPGWLERARSGETLENLELTYRRRDGSRCSTLSRLFAVRGADGEVDELVVANTDLTEHRRLEERLRHSQKMEAIGRLAGGVAHDFNNVLTTILGSTQLLRDELDPGGPAWDYADEIRDAAHRAANLVRNLMTFSRRRTAGPTDVDLNAVISGMEVFLRRLLRENIAIEARLEPGLPPVRIDPGQVEQVLANLAVNASDAMPEGGTVTVTTRRVERAPEGEPGREGAEEGGGDGGGGAGPWVVLEVSDTGLGMDEETRARIFEPFFTTKRPGQGTGLGLSTVYGITQQNAGRIEVRTTPGGGTTFRVYLPVAERPDEA